MKVGTHEKPYRTFVGNAIYVSVPRLIDPRVMSHLLEKIIAFIKIDISSSFWFHLKEKVRSK